jgi:hypothetical protein
MQVRRARGRVFRFPHWTGFACRLSPEQHAPKVQATEQAADSTFVDDFIGSFAAG